MSIVATTPLTAWIAPQLRSRRTLYLAGAAACLCAALATLWLTWWILAYSIGFVSTMLSLPLTWTGTTIAAWVVWALLFVAYVTTDPQRLERLEFEPVAHLQATRAVARITGSPMLALAGPKTASSFVKVISATLLLGPGLLATSCRLYRRAAGAWGARPEDTAELLTRLAQSDRRVPFDQLARTGDSDRISTTINSLLLLDGVLLRTSDPPGLSLTDSLRAEILQHSAASKPRKRAKPAAQV